MDIERAIEFLIDSQAKSTARMEAIDERLSARIEQVAGTVQQLAGNVQQLAGNLQQLAGVVDRSLTLFAENKAETDRRIAALEEGHRSVEAAIKDLTETQKVTELKLQAFIDNLNKGRNGHA